MQRALSTDSHYNLRTIVRTFQKLVKIEDGGSSSSSIKNMMTAIEWNDKSSTTPNELRLLQIIFPLHPRTGKLKSYGLHEDLIRCKNVTITTPLG